MIHPDEDTLLKFVLETLEAPERSFVREHLLTCEDCRNLERKLLGEVLRLQSIDIQVEVPALPGLPQRSRSFTALARLAAVLAAGFLLGYLTAQLNEPVHPIAVQQHLIPAKEIVSAPGYISCQPVDAGAAIPR